MTEITRTFNLITNKQTNYCFSHAKAHVFSEMGVMPEIAQAVEEMDWT